MGQKPNVGDRVRVISPIDDPDPVDVGVEGTVDWVNTWDSPLTRQFGVKWDNGRTLGLVDSDPYQVLGGRGPR